MDEITESIGNNKENITNKNIPYKIQFKSHIEICEMSEQDLAGRTKIIMTALEICKDKTEWNKNGICWLEQYVQDNIDSIIGAPFVTSWADEDDQIPYDHGEMTYDDDGNVQFDGVTVGSIQEGYIEDRELDGETKKVLTVKGYIYNQRYPKFVDFLKSEVNDSTVYGSIEINGKGKNKDIEYLDGRTNEDGTLKMGRIPKIFDFSGLAILSSLCEPADDSSQVIEVNNKINPIDNKNSEIKENSTEINENINQKETKVDNNKKNADNSNNNSEVNKISKKAKSNTKSKQTVEEFVSKDLIKSKSKLEVDESKDKVSDTPWGDVDKSQLKKDIIMAENFEIIAPKVFMKLGSKWKEGIEGELGYPVMQKINDTLVYNKGGLSSALGYAKTENETDIANKIEKIRKDLGLDEETDDSDEEINSINKSEEKLIQDSKPIINKKEGEQNNMNLVKKGQVVEVNNLEVYDLENLLQTAFLITIGCVNYGCDCDYWVSRLYPLNSEFIITKWNRNGDDQYYKSSYSVDLATKTVTLGDVYEVEQTWTPVNNEQPVEMNANKKKVETKVATEVKEGGEVNMDDKKTIEECNVKIGELNAKSAEKDAKIAELNEAIVNANKNMEELNKKVKDMEEEANKCKAETNSIQENYNKLVAEKAEAETNTYFETEIKKNGFEEAEVNSLKDFVTKGDLAGLKAAEAELCAKKFKEQIAKSKENVVEKVETNSTNVNMVHTKEEVLPTNEVLEGKSLFM